MGDNEDMKSQNSDAEEARKQVERILQMQEDEKNRTVLERGAWDKNFG
jgi:hypothetical protein